MRVAILSVDNREFLKRYDPQLPIIPPPQEALLSGLDGMTGLEIHVVSCLQEKVASPEKLAPNIFYHALHVPKIGWMRTLYSGCIRAVRRKLRDIAPDIVHGQGTERECAIAAALSGYPNVLTLHGIMTEQSRLLRSRPGSFYWLAARLENFALRRTGGVFCNSEYTENCVRPRARRVWRVANPLREAFFSAAPTARGPRSRVLLNVGLVCPRKRQNELIQVASELRGEGLDFELHFIGGAGRSNPYGARFLESAGQEGSFTKYLGSKSTTELIQSFDEVSALVHVPSEESFGLVVAEALTRNLKLFAFRVGGIRDIATGVDGVELFEDADWDGLKRAIHKWARSGLSQPTKAAATMRERYHPGVIARQHVEIYREVLRAPA